MLDYQNFYFAIHNLKKFMKEQDKLDAVLKVIAPSGTSVCEFGNKFIDDYIRLLEESVNDKSNWVCWFVFDNDFGAKKMKVKLPNGKEYKISSVKLFYDVCLKNSH